MIAGGFNPLRVSGRLQIIEGYAEEVKRLISLSSLGVGESRENLDFFTKHIIVDIFLRHPFADHKRQEAVVRQSSLDWTIVRPPHLIDGPRTGEYQHGFATHFRKIKSKISRADVADFMLHQLSSDTYIRRIHSNSTWTRCRGQVTTANSCLISVGLRSQTTFGSA